MHKILSKLCDHGQCHIVVLLLVVDIHQTHLFPGLLHESEERLELDVVGLAHVQNFVQKLDCGLGHKRYLRPIEVHKIFIVLE